MMTQEKKLAISERREYDALSPQQRKAFEDIGDFVRKRHPGTSANSADHRSRLLLAGDRADPLWERVASGMPLSTAVRLLREAERQWRQGNTGDNSVDMSSVLGGCLARYDREGTTRRVGDKVYRTSSVITRAARIARGDAGTIHRREGRPKTLVREAIAAWVAARLPKGDERGASFAEEAMREIEAVLDSFSHRLRNAIPDRGELFDACDLLNIPRPKWGRRADQERAWKHRTAALRSTHPDTLGHHGSVAAFQGIKDAYDVVVAYNDNLPGVSLDDDSSEGVSSED